MEATSIKTPNYLEKCQEILTNSCATCTQKELMKYTELINKWVSTWRKFPVAVWGFDVRRWENAGYEFWYGEFIKKFIFMKSMPDKGPTHLQYHSPFGFLVQWPLCIHIWYQFKPQQDDSTGNRIPGTEVVAYFRLGVARWESGSDTYILGQQYRYFNLGIGTLYAGLHWD